jgi:U3 small nucleolar RNA-associated protein 5
MNQFSKNNKYYLTIANDNRLRIYDVDSHKERHCYVEKHHLNHSYLCTAWGQARQEDLGLFAVGTSDGLILLWDLSRGVVALTIGTKNETPIASDLLFSHDLKSLLVSYASSSHINEYNLATGEIVKTYKSFKKGTIKLAKSPLSGTTGFIAAGYRTCSSLYDFPHPLCLSSTSMKYFDNDKAAKFKISSSFSGEGPSSLTFTPCGRYLICTSSGSHTSDDLMIYDLSSDTLASAPDDLEPISTHSLSGHVKTINIIQSSSSPSAPPSYQMIILFQDNRGSVVSLPITDTTTSFQQVQLQCEMNGTISPLDNLLAVALLPSSSSLLLAIGKVSLPQFIKYPYTTSASSLVIPLASSEKVSKKGSKEASASSSLEVSMVGPHESGGLKRPLVALEAEEEESEGAGEDDEEQNGKKKKQRKDSNSDINLNGGSGESSLTLEERLRNITTTLTNLEHDPEHLLKPSSSATPPPTSLTSDSLVVLIEQSLQSQDDSLLEQCLTQSAENIIIETIQRLSSNKIIPFLKKLISKFEKKSSRGLSLIKWISVILRSHTSFLLSIHDLSAQLIGLNTILEQRLSTYMRLSSLAGRLDLIMSHLPSVATTGAGGGSRSGGSDGENHPPVASGAVAHGRGKNSQQGSRGNKKNQPKQVVYED